MQFRCALGDFVPGSACLGQFNANCAKLFTARVTSSGFSWNKSCWPARMEDNECAGVKPNVSAISP